ncbi:hypothetical protein ABID70_001779 [Clavibacter michiganensis]
MQRRAVELPEVEQAAEVERGRQREHLLLGDVELAHEEVERDRVHVVRDLEADGRAEPAAQQLLLEGLDEVLGLVLLDLHVLVARDAEDVVLDDLHAGEQRLELVRDEVLERDEVDGARARVRRERHEARQHLRHLDARELLAVRLRVADAHREVERQAGDVGERVRGIHRERHEHGEYLLGEQLVQAVLLGLVERVPAHDADAVLLEGRADAVVEGGRVPDLEPVRGLVDGREHLGGGAADVGGDGEARRDAALEAGDADHEELVEVAREDGEEVGALEDRQLRVLGELQHAAVEGQPAQLAVEEAPLGEGPVVLEDLVLVEVVQGFGDRLRIADVRLAVHPPIMASRCALRPPAGERGVNRIGGAPGARRGRRGDQALRYWTSTAASRKAALR